MKKYIVSTGLILAAISSVSAAVSDSSERVTTVRGSAAITGAVVPSEGLITVRGVSAQRAVPASQMMAAMPILTGDPATDAKIKALQQEMEAKIKAIREEYQAKIKAAIGDKKILQAGGRNGTTTPPGMRIRTTNSMERAGGENEGGMRGQGMGIPQDSQVRGESTGNVDVQLESRPAQSEGGIRGFFGRLFGR